VQVVRELRPDDPRRVGRYRIMKRLGSGGMGNVFLGQSKSGEWAAVKVVREELADDPDFRRRFAREVATARKVSSNFTAGVIDANPIGNPAWLATTYVPGPSLREAIELHGPWSIGAAGTLGLGVAEALQAIHAHGIVHRDLKPSNVLLGEDGPRVIDFGISVALDATRLTMTTQLIGTPGYMAPEQLTGRDVGPATDVFAFGILLAYIATGRSPFGDGEAHAIGYRIVHERPNLDDVPGELRPVIERCLAKSPNQRLSVGRLLRRLRAVKGVGDSADAADTATWLPEPVTGTLRERATALASTKLETLNDSSSPYRSARTHFAPTGPRWPNSKPRAPFRPMSPLRRPILPRWDVRGVAQRWSRWLAASGIVLVVVTSGLWWLSSTDDSGPSRAEFLRIDADGAAVAEFISDTEVIVANISNREVVNVTDDPPGEVLRVRDLEAGAWSEIELDQPAISGFAMSPDGTHVATGSPGARWQLDRDGLTGFVRGPARYYYTGHTAIRELDGEADERTFGGPYHAESIDEAWQGTVTAVAFAPDGSVLASSYRDGVTYLWDPGSGELVRQLDDVGTARLTYSPDGALLAGGTPGAITLVDVASGELEATLTADETSVGAAAFSPDGHLLAATAGHDGVQIWSVDDASLEQTLAGHDGAVRAVAWSPDGTILASGFRDGTVLLWDTETWQVLDRLEHKERYLFWTAADVVISTVAFSPDGSTLVAAGRTNPPLSSPATRLAVWDLPDYSAG
jgi:serine/threonine protein kinase